MKQSDLDKMLNAILRQSAKTHGWKQSRGFVFKATDDLFFSVSILSVAKTMRLVYHLEFKPLAFDDLFWKIVNLEENSKEPLSFRACGAWTAPMNRAYEGDIYFEEWDEEQLRASVDKIIAEAEHESAKLDNEIRSLDDSLELIEKLYSKHLETYPGSHKDIWLERLLTAILVADYSKAENIIHDRIYGGYGGGFHVGPVTFYGLARDFLQTARRKP